MKPCLPLLTFLLLSSVALTKADVKLPSIFSEHIVLQKSASVPVWGKADPGENITVDFNGHSAKTTAAADGKWKLALNLADSAAGPFDMTVSGKNKITIHDVVIGQSWLVIGQSNPERLLKESANAPAEIARSANPLIREFRIERKAADQPQDDVRGKWFVASPETTADFGAIGYYFSKKLQGELRQPIGFISGSQGGTFIEAWVSEEAIDKDPPFRAGENARRKEMTDFQAVKAAYAPNMSSWLKSHNREDRPHADVQAYAGEGVSTAGWTPVTLPGPVSGPGLPTNGAIWLRKEIDLPASLQGIPTKVTLGQMSAFEETYWNGKKIYEMPYQQLPGEGYNHYFSIPLEDMKAGKAVFAIRLYAPGPAPVIKLAPERFAIGPIPIKGEWMAKAEYSLPELPPAEVATMPTLPRQPPGLKAAALFNGIIHPIIPYGLAGILWYQGESNVSLAYDYRVVFPLFINDLRERWHDPNLPFYFCQLTNYQPKLSAPGDSAWAELRESQSTALKLPNTAQAVLIDLGESDDIHARNKLDVGERLARIALAKQYGQTKLVYSGPVYQSMAVEGSMIRLHFAHVDGGLVAKPLPKTYDVRTLMNQTAPLVPNSPGSQLEGFAICGADRHWVWADAKIDGDTVVVSSNKVSAPVAVRYAWAENPTCNLYNAGGLPASPFRTDDFPAMTVNHHFGLTPDGRY